MLLVFNRFPAGSALHMIYGWKAVVRPPTSSRKVILRMIKQQISSSEPGLRSIISQDSSPFRNEKRTCLYLILQELNLKRKLQTNSYITSIISIYIYIFIYNI